MHGCRFFHSITVIMQSLKVRNWYSFFFLIQHHCRHCGRIFCADCITKSVNSGPMGRPAKVCDVCHTILVKDATPYFSREPPVTPDWHTSCTLGWWLLLFFNSFYCLMFHFPSALVLHLVCLISSSPFQPWRGGNIFRRSLKVIFKKEHLTSWSHVNVLAKKALWLFPMAWNPWNDFLGVLVQCECGTDWLGLGECGIVVQNLIKRYFISCKLKFI